uniref:Putative heme oxygenase 1 n=1 Tax=Rhizophora mucronata TaxID=61149 RepID=A0A2P2PV90_RHIMU
MILLISRPTLSNFVQLVPDILQQLGKITIPFIEF